MKVDRLETSVYTIPTDRPEADGTIAWDETSMVVVEAVADSGERGLGYSYASRAAAVLVAEKLEGHIRGRHIDDVRAAWTAMVATVRNVGRQGIAATAISAVDIALWDLRARAHQLPLHVLLGPHRREVPIYGSGGFTTYTDEQLTEQLGGWVGQGIPRVKMKIGTDWGADPGLDLERITVARRAIGDRTQLFIDANGAYQAKQALGMTERLTELGVVYFEEPVSSDQLPELALIRRSTPFDIAAGEYGYDPWYFERMLDAGAVDVLQADMTRCLGVTGWLMAADLAYARGIPFSAHTAPSLHVQVGCAAPEIAHLEYFWDHIRIETMIFDGAPAVRPGGVIAPDPGWPGLGLELRRADAERWRVG
ncbi:MAG: enolase C-terminal domain-like protein [Candidatus Dormibacteraceae bacterium]